MATCTSLYVSSGWSASAMQVTAIEGPGTVDTGSETLAYVTIENRNDQNGGCTISLELDGSEIASKGVQVAANDSRTFDVPFTAPTTPGDFQLCAYATNEGPVV